MLVSPCTLILLPYAEARSIRRKQRAPHNLVQELAREVGKKGIAVNAIIPTVSEGAGIHTIVKEDAPIKGFMKDFCPMGRVGEPGRRRQCRGVLRKRTL